VVDEEELKNHLAKKMVAVLEDEEGLKVLLQEVAILVEEDQTNVLLIDQKDLKEVLAEKKDPLVVSEESAEIHKTNKLTSKKPHKM
jgi:hypothetical protein